MQNFKFFKGIILNPQSDFECDYFFNGLLVTKKIKDSYFIKEIINFDDGVKKYKKWMTANNTTDFGQSVIMPGFFDMHFHWVQDDVREMPKDSLLDWLNKYTFPTEMKFASKKYSQKKAKHFFKKLLRHGTVGGACYSSIHECALDAAMKNAKGHFVIGNVLMNMHSPEKLTQSENEAIKLTQRLVKKYKKRFCFTPRFAITTTPKVMKTGSQIADKKGCFKQTHLSETPQEIEFVLSIYKKIPGFEKVKTYTEIYEKTGMLGKKSLMGHGIHLSDKELKTLYKTKTSIIHCPTSNAPIKDLGLGSGLFNFKKVEKSNVRWALGSDIGGGPFLSMFDVMRSFVHQNKRKNTAEATYTKALFRSTLAGAQLLGVDKKVGNLNKNKEATFVVVPVEFKVPPRDAEFVLKKIIESKSNKRQDYEQLVQKVIYRGKVLT